MEEATFPNTLQEIKNDIFKNALHLKTVRVPKSCQAEARKFVKFPVKVKLM